MHYKTYGHKIQHVLNNEDTLDAFWFLPVTKDILPELLFYEDLLFHKMDRIFPTKFFQNDKIQIYFHIDKMRFYEYI